MPPFSFSPPTYILIKDIYMDETAIQNAKVVIDESRISNGNINDLQIQLSNDGGMTWITQSANDTSVIFAGQATSNALFCKIIGKSGLILSVDDSRGRAFSVIKIKYNEVI